MGAQNKKLRQGEKCLIGSSRKVNRGARHMRLTANHSGCQGTTWLCGDGSRTRGRPFADRDHPVRLLANGELFHPLQPLSGWQQQRSLDSATLCSEWPSHKPVLAIDSVTSIGPKVDFPAVDPIQKPRCRPSFLLERPHMPDDSSSR